MIQLHAIWDGTSLHVFGVCAERCENSHTPASRPPLPVFLPLDALRQCIGDDWDALLIAGGRNGSLSIRWPCPVAGVVLLRSGGPAGQTGSDPVLRSFRVDTLSLPATDAVDLLTAHRSRVSADLAPAGSFQYWSRVAGVVMELLAKQRFVPTIHRSVDGSYHGYWRPVVDDPVDSARLGFLIAGMPPVCRAFCGNPEAIQADDLIERFLLSAVDGLVRRCLEGDDLAHAIVDHPDDGLTQQLRWLRSLVEAGSSISQDADSGRALAETVRRWLSQLPSYGVGSRCRTCFRLDAPANGSRAAGEAWHLTLHAQSTSDPTVVMEAAELARAQSGDFPRILPRPFDHALTQVRQDAERAAKHFPCLSACAAVDGPLDRVLSTEDAYHFLRNAAPLLESDGFGVWLPAWWRRQRPRLQMRLHLEPVGSTPAVHTKAGVGLDALVSYDWRVAVADDECTAEELAALAAAQDPLVWLRGQWTEVQPTDVQKALSFLKRRRPGRMTVAEALQQCYLADDLNTGVPVAGLRATGWLSRLLDANAVNDQLVELSQPEGFCGELRPYQLRGVSWLSFLCKLNLGGCLADDMGLGKTIQLIALWLIERSSGTSPGPTLLVVPTSLVGNWQREIVRFAPCLRTLVHHGLERLSGRAFVEEVARHDVVISTYALTHRDFDHLGAIEWHRIALDEAQNIKNPAAKQTAAIRGLRSVHRVALTGTPVENRLSELWSILDFLNPGYLSSGADFRRRFAVPIERYHDADRADRLRSLIRPFVLRRVKSDPTIEVDLPEKMEMKVFCNLTKEQAALYQSVVGDMVGTIDHAQGIQRRGLILAALVKLKQICNHPEQFLQDGGAVAHRSGKCDRLTEMLEEVIAEGDRALVFTQFRRMGHILQRHVRELFGTDVLFLHGGTPRAHRDAMVERFQKKDETPIFILSLKAGGYGLNLTAANHVFHFDRWWNPAVEDQATDRAHRIGQNQRVQVHKFVCVGTLEERIDALLTEKRSLADSVVGTGEDWLTSLSTEELRDLFRLSAEAVSEE